MLKITGEEFLRRFTMHILPPRFVRVRHYGILGNFKRKERLREILKKFKMPPHPEKLKAPTNIANLCRFRSSEILCPKCKKGSLVLHYVELPRSRDGPKNAIQGSVLKDLKDFK